MNMPRVNSKGFDKHPVLPDSMPPSFPSHNKRSSYQQRQLSRFYPPPSNHIYPLQYSQQMPYHVRSSQKNLHHGRTHHPCDEIYFQVRTGSEKNQVLCGNGSKASLKGRKRSIRYTEDNLEGEMEGSSDEQRYKGSKKHIDKRNLQMGHPPKPRARAAYLEQQFLPRSSRSPKSIGSGNSRSSHTSKSPEQMQQKDKKQVFYRHYRTVEDNLKVQEDPEVEISLAKRLEMMQVNYCADIGMRNKLEKFSHYLSFGMEKLIDKMEELESKHSNVNIYLSELRKSVHQQKKPQKLSDNSISEARQRQNSFLMNEYESKTKQLKMQNEKMEKELINLKNKQADSKARAEELLMKVKDYEKFGSLEQLKRTKIDLQRKLADTQSKLLRVEKEKTYIEEQFQQFKRRSFQPRFDLYSSNNGDDNILESQGGQRSTQLLTEQLNRLTEKLSRVEEDNKAYEKLLSSKSDELSSEVRASCESKMLLEKMKEINADLQKQCQLLQKEKMQNDVEVTDKICNLNNNLKKKTKQFDSFKGLMIECLDKVYKQVSKKVRKVYDRELTNKNRTAKCQIYLKGIGEYVKNNQDSNAIVLSFLQKLYGISASQIDRSGYEAVFVKITNMVEEDRQKIAKLVSSMRQMEYEAQEVKVRQQTSPQKILPFCPVSQGEGLKRMKSNGTNKDVPSHDVQPKHSTFQAQELNKKKEEISKLSREIARVTEEAHKQYLVYEEKIGQLEIREKQLNSKLSWAQEEKQELNTKIAQKDEQIRVLKQNSEDLKRQNQILSGKIAELNGELKRGGSESNAKLNKLEQQLDLMHKKMKKMKAQFESKQKTLNNTISRKDKTIDQLTEEKKKNTVELKILNERLEFAKVLEETKEKTKKVEEPIEEPIVNQNSLYLKRLQDLNSHNDLLQTELSTLSKKIKELNSEVDSKSKEIINLTKDLKKRSTQLQEAKILEKERQERRQNVQEQYKRVIEKMKAEHRQKAKVYEQDKKEKNKQIHLLKKQLSQKEEILKSIEEQKFEQAGKVSEYSQKLKQYEQRLSQFRIQKEELVKAVNKKDAELQDKDSMIEDLQSKLKQEQGKQSEMSQQLLQRQEYFRKSEELMGQVVAENAQMKEELSIKEQENVQLAKLRDELNQKLSQEKGVKDQQLTIAKENYESEIILLKSQVSALENHLDSLKGELKLKNDHLAELKKEKQVQKQELNCKLQAKSQVEQQTADQLQEIQNLKNRIDILEEQAEEAQVRLKDRDQELENVKKEKIKYYKTLQEKYEYIEQLEEALKIKVNEVGVLQQREEDNQALKEKYEQKQEMLKEELQNLKEKMEVLEEKFVKELNEKKKVIDQLQKQRTALKGSIDESQQKVHDLQKENRVMREEYNGILKECQDKNVELKGVSDKAQSTKKGIQQKQDEIQRLEEEVEQLKSRSKQMKNQLLKREQQVQQKNKKIEGLIVALKQKESQLQQMRIKSEQFKVELNKELEVKCEYVKGVIQQNQSHEQDLKEHIELLERHKRKLTEEISRKNEEMKTITEEHWQQLMKKEAEIRQMAIKGSELMARLEGKCNQLKQSEEALSQFKAETERQLAIKSAEIDSLKQHRSQSQTCKQVSEDYKQHYEELMSELNSKSQQHDKLKIKLQQLCQQYEHEQHQKEEEYKNSLAVLERQNASYQEAIVVITLKCQTLEKENNELKQLVEEGLDRDRQNFILGQSPNSLQFNSVQFDMPQRGNILSGEEPYKNFQIVSKVAETIYEGLQSKSAKQIQQNQQNEEEDGVFISCQSHSKSAVKSSRSVRSVLSAIKVDLQGLDPTERRYLDELLKCKAELELTLYAKENLSIELQQLQKQMRQYEQEMKEMIEQQEAEEQQSQRRFINQSEVFKKEIHRQKERATAYMVSFNSLRKVVDQLMEVVLSRQSKRGQMEDCCDQLEMLCRGADQDIKAKVKKYMEWYDDLKRNLYLMKEPNNVSQLKKEEKSQQDRPIAETAWEVKKKKRGWF